MRRELRLLVLFMVFSSIGGAQITELNKWLETAVEDRVPLESLSFAEQALSKDDADAAIKLLVADKQNQMLDQYGEQWDDRKISYENYEMPFFYEIFGEKPEGGRSLFISLHGGGGAPAYVNDQQYENQKHLYDQTMRRLEGVYLAPRAPTDTWNLWHLGHIDELLNLIIQLAVIKEDVNPNKVYLMGYSAGGDGVYQLAPRMADRWAAASMMAGHPNNASPLGLRNTPFAIHMGELDSAYNRNDKAKEWAAQLRELQQKDTEGYKHNVQLHAGLGHWMNLQDAVALPWMKQYQRSTLPRKVVWKQDDVHRNSLFWLGQLNGSTLTGTEILAEYDPFTNEINIIKNDSEIIELMINDQMLDIDQPIGVRYQGKLVYRGYFQRTILNIHRSLSIKGDPGLVFPTIASLKENKLLIEPMVSEK